jgi:2-polyprenyl-6-methoxyphenol hydroxylase-like FAD-dependent oxidoreductase
MTNTSVLIVGAGPTGLNLALSLARRDVRCRIISEADGPGEHSRAMVVQARTLEFYDQLGFAEEVVRQGIKAEAAHLLEGGPDGSGREVASFSFAEMGEGLSPYPFALAYPQDDHEQFLIEKLKAAGRTVEWRSKLTGFSEGRDGVRATVSRDGQTEEIHSAYICGCDGAHSCVRETLGVGFPGGTYDQLFYVADVKINRSLERDLYIYLGSHILTLMFPVRSSGMQRLIGLVPPELSNRQDLTFEDIRSQVEPLLNLKVTDVNWFSTYRVHHRVAERFRVGSAFLLGDAGHIHSPAGGQGMNTGIGDAMNLGWKLAQVVQDRADAALLDAYEPERIGFARTLVSTTDRAFTPMVAEGWRGEVTRRVLAPLFFAVMTRSALGRRTAFRLVSQTRIHYPDSPLSSGTAGEISGGDRLPWVRAEDNLALLRSLDWQVHVYGTLNGDFEAECRNLGLPTHAFRWSDEARDAGMECDAAYFVRPDGHVSVASSEQNLRVIKPVIDRFGLKFGIPNSVMFSR